MPPTSGTTYTLSSNTSKVVALENATSMAAEPSATGTPAVASTQSPLLAAKAKCFVAPPRLMAQPASAAGTKTPAALYQNPTTQVIGASATVVDSSPLAP